MVLATPAACGDGLGSDVLPESSTSTGKADGTSIPDYAGYYAAQGFECFGGCRMIVAGLNAAPIRCADGTWQESCRISEWDWTTISSDPAVQQRLYDAVGSQGGLVLADVEASHNDKRGDRCDVFGAWQKAGDPDAAPQGIFYRIKANGVRCVAAPCFAYTAVPINNAGPVTNVSGVDFGPNAGKSADRAWSDIFERGGIVAAGSLQTVPHAGPAGDGITLTASQFYLRHQPDATSTAQP
jgi:hypothetical protein